MSTKENIKEKKVQVYAVTYKHIHDAARIQAIKDGVEFGQWVGDAIERKLKNSKSEKAEV